MSNYRSPQLTKMKLSSNISQGSILIAESANMSEFYGHVDGCLLETVIQQYDFNTSNIISITHLARTRLHKVIKVTLVNGELVIVKQVNIALGFTKEKSMTLLYFIRQKYFE